MTSPPLLPDHFIDAPPFPCTVNEHKSYIHDNYEIRNPVHYNNQTTYLKRSRTCKYYMGCGCRRNDCPFGHYIDQNSALYPIYIALNNIERRQMNPITLKKQYESLTHEIKQQNLLINKLYEENKRVRAEMNGIRKCIQKTNKQMNGAQMRLDYDKDSVFKDMMNKVEGLEQNISSNLKTKFEKIEKSLQKQMQSIQNNIVKKLDKISNQEIVELLKNQSSANKKNVDAEMEDNILRNLKHEIKPIQNTLSNLAGIVLSRHSIKHNSSQCIDITDIMTSYKGIKKEMEETISKSMNELELQWRLRTENEQLKEEPIKISSVHIDDGAKARTESHYLRELHSQSTQCNILLNQTKDKLDETLSKSLSELELKWSLPTENKEESIKLSSIYIDDGAKERNESNYLRELLSQTTQCNILKNQTKTNIDEYNNTKTEFDTKYHENDYRFNFESKSLNESESVKLIQSHHLRELQSQTRHYNSLLKQTKDIVDKYNNIKNVYVKSFRGSEYYKFDFKYEPNIVHVVDEGLLMIKDLIFSELNQCFVQDIDTVSISLSDEDIYEDHECLGDREETKHEYEKS